MFSDGQCVVVQFIEPYQALYIFSDDMLKIQFIELYQPFYMFSDGVLFSSLNLTRPCTFSEMVCYRFS